jgi:putative Mg2+ transporter-C (MgtC) family protein
MGETTGPGWMQLGELALAFVLSALIGLEREIKQKNAGLRTYTLVGVAAALFMLVSKYGFMDVILAYRVVLDPSRVAAQVVSGIGFIGAGVILMRRDVVRGLTTAASVWITAAVGMACGAGLPIWRWQRPSLISLQCSYSLSWPPGCLSLAAPRMIFNSFVNRFRFMPRNS